MAEKTPQPDGQEEEEYVFDVDLIARRLVTPMDELAEELDTTADELKKSIDETKESVEDTLNEIAEDLQSDEESKKKSDGEGGE